MAERRRLGLVVNPVAGLGGAAGLKGSDGVAIQERARMLGATERAHVRVTEALTGLPREVPVLTVAGPMGEWAAQAAGITPSVVWTPPGETSGADTSFAVAALVEAGADLILFGGGDGTARDVLAGLSAANRPLVGVPCGVKMYSGVFAVSPVAAGRIARSYLGGSPVALEDREVLDISEDQVRAGHVDATLYGFAVVPVVNGHSQARKTATPATEASAVEGVATGLAARLQPGHTYFLGPGSTIAALARRLGVKKTPLGVDVVRDGLLLVADASARELADWAADGPAHAVVTVIGGQGFPLGRGNQQLSADVVRALSEPRLVVGATRAKLLGLPGALLVDTGEPALDRTFHGFQRVVTGVQDVALVPIRSATPDVTEGSS